MTISMEIASQDLFIIEAREDRPAFAKKVTCKLCGEILFDAVRNAEESLDVFFHGLKAHFQIQHDVTLGTPPVGGRAESLSSGH